MIRLLSFPAFSNRLKTGGIVHAAATMP